jgi:hypothetical protein
MERLLGVSGLRNLHGDGAGRGIELLGLIAIGVATPLRVALIETGLEVTFTFQPHGPTRTRP